MATGKNTVLVYRDWMATFEALDDDEAGRLIKHFFKFINDEHPVAPDKITKIAFAPIQQCLERDLKSWDKVVEKRAETGANGGKKSGETRRKKADERSKTKQNEANVNFASTIEANEAVKDKDNVTVKEVYSKEENENNFNFEFIEPGWKIPFMDWFHYRHQRKPFPLQVSAEAAYKELKEISGSNVLEACKIVQYSMSNSFLSLVKKNENTNKYTPQPGATKSKVFTPMKDT